MYSFKNDYSEGAHPNILRKLVDTNNIQTEGYELDVYSKEATQILKDLVANPFVDIHFFHGGTLTNLTSLSAFLRPHEAIISPESGHIYVHETGAIEATGHKVFPVPTIDGKLNANQVQEIVDAHTDEHMVKPKLVYISNSTETGTVYTKAELLALREVCDRNGLYLYLDGARLGYALMSEFSDLSLADLSNYCDAFYIGATKCGALMGEALIIVNESLKSDFRHLKKQRGAITAKGRILGIQFAELFRDNLYFDLAAHGNAMAKKLSSGITALGYELMAPYATNVILPILPTAIIALLEKDFSFYIWAPIDEENASIRLVTSWITQEKQVDAFIDALKSATPNA